MNKIVPRLGWILGFVLSIVPLVLWLPAEPWHTYFGDKVHIYGTLAKATGLVGTAMFAYSIILSARLKIVEWMFDGLDRLYAAHKWFGKVAFVLIMGHVIFLTLRSSTGYRGGVGKLWQSHYWPIQAGYIGFYGMVVALLGSTLIRMKHQNFIRLHALLGPFFIVGGYHAYAMRSQLADNKALAIYMAILLTLATWAYIYQTVLGRWLLRKYKYIVQDVHLLADNIIEIVLCPSWRPINFTPGQFGFVTFDDPAVDDEGHPYAMCSNPHDRQLRVVVKNLGDYTAQLKFLSIGSPAYIEGPYGAFSYLNAKRRRQVWVAGGIGITPFLAMARSLPKRSKYRVDLYYCTKVKEEAVFAKELRQISKTHPYFKTKTVCEASDGFLTSETIAKGSNGLSDKEFYICGPPVMMKALRAQLEATGVAPELIHTEEFAFR